MPLRDTIGSFIWPSVVAYAIDIKYDRPLAITCVVMLKFGPQASIIWLHSWVWYVLCRQVQGNMYAVLCVEETRNT